MSQDGALSAAFEVGRFFVSDIYAFYQDTYRGVLGKVQVEALDYLHVRGQASIKELAERLNIPKQHASKIVGKLEELGLARRARDPEDGRSWLFSLTDDGRSFVGEHIAQSNKHLVAYLDSLGEKDRQDLLASLETAARIVGSHHAEV